MRCVTPNRGSPVPYTTALPLHIAEGQAPGGCQTGDPIIRLIGPIPDRHRLGRIRWIELPQLAVLHLARLGEHARGGDLETKLGDVPCEPERRADLVVVEP